MALGRIFGIQIHVDFSVLIVFALVVYSLGAALFSRWHPTWNAGTTWSTALAAGVLFFASLLAHELSHSVVAKLRGIPVPRITLFIFGGVSELEREPNTPATEFLIAIVGPAMSALLGFVFTWLGVTLAGADFAGNVFEDPEATMAHLGPAATLFLWLGPINFMLAFFNLIPGFPLDGGRVLRATLWSISGDLRSATLWASNAGRAFAWTLMGFGVLQALGGGFVQGVWLLLIGWFLNNAARNSYKQLLVRQAFEELMVGNLMRTHFEVISPDVTLDEFVNEFLLRSAQSAWPVIEGDRAVGLITFEQPRWRMAAADREAKRRLRLGVGRFPGHQLRDDGAERLQEGVRPAAFALVGQRLRAEGAPEHLGAPLGAHGGLFGPARPALGRAGVALRRPGHLGGLHGREALELRVLRSLPRALARGDGRLDEVALAVPQTRVR